MRIAVAGAALFAWFFITVGVAIGYELGERMSARPYEPDATQLKAELAFCTLASQRQLEIADSTLKWGKAGRPDTRLLTHAQVLAERAAEDDDR